jgi:hypothetical protein
MDSLAFADMVFHTEARQWVKNVKRLDDRFLFLVEFDAIVCTPPRVSPYLNLTRKQIREQLKAFGFSRP